MQIDVTSQTWRQIKQWAEAELQRAREDLEFTGIDVREADQCRGDIRRLKALLDLAKPPVSTNL